MAIIQERPWPNSLRLRFTLGQFIGSSQKVTFMCEGSLPHKLSLLSKEMYGGSVKIC